MWRIMIDFLVLGFVYITIFYKKWRLEGNEKLITKTLMFIYISLVLYVTIMPVITSLPFMFNMPYTPMNLIPFDDYFSGRGDTVRQIILNIIMVIPFGFLLPIIGKHTLKSVVMYTFLFSLGIELIQPLLHGHRISDVTDIINNVLGGCLGYGLYVVFKPLIRKILT